MNINQNKTQPEILLFALYKLIVTILQKAAAIDLQAKVTIINQ
jgi:hypothetical protein